MGRLKNHLISFLLFALLLSFLLAIFVEKPTNPVVIILFLLFTITTAILIVKAEFASGGSSEKRSSVISNISLVIASALGAVATYWIANIPQLHLGAVIASAFVGLVGWFISRFINNKIYAKTIALSVYCGSFVGMSSIQVMPDLFTVGIAGSLCGIVFVLAQSHFVGAGGKLGTIAFVGSAITVLIFSFLDIR